MVATIGIQDDECVVSLLYRWKWSYLGWRQKWNLFQDTSSEEEFDDELLQSGLQALKVELSLLQTPDNVMQIQISDKRNETFPAKVAGTHALTLYDTGANNSCVFSVLYQIKRSPTFANYTISCCMLICNHIEYYAIAMNTPYNPELWLQRVFHQVKSKAFWFWSITSIILIFACILG